MTEVVAKLRHLRIAPKKVRRVAGVIRGMPVLRAEAELLNRPQKSAGPLKKLLRSAIANAEHNLRIPKTNLYISKVLVDPGPSLKRMLPRAFGRATPILKRTSHVTMILGTRAGQKVKEAEEAVRAPQAVIFEEKKPVAPERGAVEGASKPSLKTEKLKARKALREPKKRSFRIKERFTPRFFRRKAI